MNEKEKFILDDLKERKTVSSWDWQADKRFVYKFYPELTEYMQKLLGSYAPHSIRFAFHKQHFGKIKSERLSILKKLEKQGLVISAWMGLGAGGYSDFGVRRIKTYELNQQTQSQ